MDVRTACVLACLAAVMLAAPIGTAAAMEPVATETFSGDLVAYTGVDRVGPAHVGAYVGGVASPEGIFSVPADAEEARVRVGWAPESPTAERFLFRVCEGICGDPGARTLAEVGAATSAKLSVQIPASGNLTWEALVARGATVNATVEGTASHLAPAADSEPRATPTAHVPPQDGTGPGWTLLGAVIGLGVVGALAVAVRRRLWPWWLALYHRIEDDDRLDHPTRRRIRALVEEEPGRHFNALRTRLDLSRGQLEHHLRLLLDADLLVETSTTGYRCFFLPGDLDPGLERAAAGLRSLTARCLIQTISDTGGRSLLALAEEVDVAVSTVAYHVDRLEARGLVRRERAGQRVAIRPTPLGRRAVERLL